MPGEYWQLVSDFFFPSELHDTLPLDIFGSSFAPHLTSSSLPHDLGIAGGGQGQQQRVALLETVEHAQQQGEGGGGRRHAAGTERQGAGGLVAMVRLRGAGEGGERG